MTAIAPLSTGVFTPQQNEAIPSEKFKGLAMFIYRQLLSAPQLMVGRMGLALSLYAIVSWKMMGTMIGQEALEAIVFAAFLMAVQQGVYLSIFISDKTSKLIEHIFPNKEN